MGRKKAEDETDGTWLRLAELAGRLVLVELPPVLPARLALFPDNARRSGVGCGQAALCAAIVDLTVPVCDGPILSLCASCSRPSSVPISVMREDMILGGLGVCGCWGKVSSLASAPPAGILAVEPSRDAMALCPCGWPCGWPCGRPPKACSVLLTQCKCLLFAGGCRFRAGSLAYVLPQVERVINRDSGVANPRLSRLDCRSQKLAGWAGDTLGLDRFCRALPKWGWWEIARSCSHGRDVGDCNSGRKVWRARVHPVMEDQRVEMGVGGGMREIELNRSKECQAQGGAESNE